MPEKVNFWETLPPSAKILAPMEDVTDTVFRQVVLSVAQPGRIHVLYTEFVNTDGLCHPKGGEKVKHRLYVSDDERKLLTNLGVKLVAQIWGNNPDKFKEAVRYIDENYAFDGIDINMGCPVRKIVRQGGCSALIGNPSLAKEIIYAVKENTTLPVSIKTRTGIKQHQTVAWIETLMSTLPDAIILHCRCQADMSEKPADWSQMNYAVELRDRLGLSFPLIGNGDIFTETDADRFIAQTGANGTMIARGIFQNPWLFSAQGYIPNTIERLALIEKHVRLFESTWDKEKPFAMLRRFFKIYIRDFEGATALRVELMKSNSYEEALGILRKFAY